MDDKKMCEYKKSGYNIFLKIHEIQKNLIILKLMLV